MSRASAHAETYRPRRMAGLGIWRMGGATLKAYGIDAGSGELEPTLVDEAKACLARHAPEEDALGFAILHRGEEGIWLLLHWWMAGGILAERLWRRDLAGEASFRAVDRPLMACVWELVPIGFERDAYVATIMAGGTRQDYLDRFLPDGSR